MGRVFGILVIVVGVWLASRLLLGEIDEAAKNPELNGSAVEQAAERSPNRTGPQAVGDRVRKAFANGNARREAVMPE